jgi:hypothetical protein
VDAYIASPVVRNCDVAASSSLAGIGYLSIISNSRVFSLGIGTVAK